MRDPLDQAQQGNQHIHIKLLQCYNAIEVCNKASSHIWPMIIVISSKAIKSTHTGKVGIYCIVSDIAATCSIVDKVCVRQKYFS